MLSELSMGFVAVEHPEQLQALENKVSLPGEIETALVEAQLGMKKEVKNVCVSSSHAALESIS